RNVVYLVLIISPTLSILSPHSIAVLARSDERTTRQPKYRQASHPFARASDLSLPDRPRGANPLSSRPQGWHADHPCYALELPPPCSKAMVSRSATSGG